MGSSCSSRILCTTSSPSWRRFSSHPGRRGIYVELAEKIALAFLVVLILALPVVRYYLRGGR
jgi:hypothetical protein